MPLYSPPCWRVRQLQRWAWEHVGREKLLLRCRLLGRARRFGAHGGRRGAGHIVAAARLQLVLLCVRLVSSSVRYISYSCGTIWPVCGEGAVKQQSTNQPYLESLVDYFLCLRPSFQYGNYIYFKWRHSVCFIERLKDGNIHMCFFSRSGYRPSINPPPSLPTDL